MTHGWLSLDEFLKRYEKNASTWMSERDERLAQKKRDEPNDDRRRRNQPERPREELT